MGPLAGDLAHVASVMWRCPSADLIAFEVDATTMKIASSYLDLIEVRAHASGWEDAERFARALGLPEISGGNRYPDTNAAGNAGFQIFRRWQGWIAGVSSTAPVSAQVFGADFIEDAQAAEVDASGRIDPVGRPVPKAV